MPQIDFVTAILVAAGTLFLGFFAAFLIQNGRISAIKKENAILKTEKESLSEEISEERKKRENLLYEISEKERELAVKETILKTETFRANEAERKNSELTERNEILSEKLSATTAKAAAAIESTRAINEWIEKADSSLKDSFASISKNITENNNRVFLESANDKVGGIVAPVSNELKELRAKVEELEQKRASAYSGLTEKVENLQKQNSELKNATDLLNSTLKNNAQRG